MADRMAFPNTMKEFIESFSFKDSEEVYTNGAELIPVFRAEQGFEHYAKEIRVKAIDEFVEKAIKIVYESNNRDRNPQPRDVVADIHYKLLEIAKQLKAGDTE